VIRKLAVRHRASIAPNRLGPLVPHRWGTGTAARSAWQWAVLVGVRTEDALAAADASTV